MIVKLEDIAVREVQVAAKSREEKVLPVSVE